MKSIAVILGSAFSTDSFRELNPQKKVISTDFGAQALYKVEGQKHPVYLLFRHSLPHRLLPHQINYRAQAAALKKVNCCALLVSSSVGVMDAGLPLFKPMLVRDLMMPENRLPDGSVCTMFDEPSDEHGHLVLNEGLFSRALSNQICELAGDIIVEAGKDIVFAYACGPRGKTKAENNMWIKLGAHVNSMTLAPEVILANELEIPCAGLVVGHKYSVPGKNNPNEDDVSSSLEESRTAMKELILAFIQHGTPVEFANHIYRFQ